MDVVIKTIKDHFVKLAESHADEILASEGQYLQVVSHQVALKISQELAPKVYKLLQQTEELDTLRKNETFLQLEKVLMKAQEIKSLVQRAHEALDKACKRIREHQPPLVKEEELAELKRSLFNDYTSPRELAVFTDAERNYEEITRTFCTNSAIASNLFADDKEISLEELTTKNPRLAWHARKTAFDQICLSVFGYFPHDYDTLKKVEIISAAHKLNELAEFKVKKGEVIFAYVNAQPMSIPKFPRFAHLLNTHEGAGVVVEDVDHQSEIIPVHCVIAGKKVVVKVPVWYGLVLTSKTEVSSKPLNFKDLIKEAEVNTQAKPEGAREHNHLPVEKHFINSFKEIFKTLATSQDSDYNRRYQALLAKGR